MAIGSDGAGTQIGRIWAENQHDSKSSRSVLAAFGRSLNQRVEGSIPSALTIGFQ